MAIVDRKSTKNPRDLRLQLASLPIEDQKTSKIPRCPIAREVWGWVGQRGECSSLSPRSSWNSSSPLEIVQMILNETAPRMKQGTKTLLLLTCWEIWQERNRCTFRGKLPSPSDITREVGNSIELWRQAGAVCLQSPFGDPP